MAEVQFICQSLGTQKVSALNDIARQLDIQSDVRRLNKREACKVIANHLQLIGYHVNVPR